MTNTPEITNAELQLDHRQLWLKGLSAIEQKNYDYAITLILPVIKDNPGFLEGRKTIRNCQAILAGAKEGAKVFGLTIGGKGKGASSKLKSLVKKDPLKALSQVEDEIGEDPGSPEINDALHNSAAALGMVSTAEFALETVREKSPKNTKLLHKLALFYINNQKFAEASAVYNTIISEDPTDSEAVKGEKDCMAKASMQSSTTSTGELKMKDDAERINIEKMSRTGLTKEQLVERRDILVAQYNTDQTNIETVKQLANTYEQLDNFASAQSFYEWAFKISESDKTLQNKASEMKARLDEQKIHELNKALATDPNNEELKAQLKELESASIMERIKDYEARVDENPTDADLRYNLGKAYFDADKFGEAIPHLQQARSNPGIEVKTLLLLGQTFDAKGMTDMAISQLENANAKILIMDGMKKETLYQLALLREKTGNNEGYIDALKEIYSVDYGYRDVASRVESSY